MACNRRCPKCPGTHPIIQGDGSTDSRIMFVGEFPAKDKYRPLIGKDGAEFNEHYLPLAGLMREDVYVTNTLKCHWDNKKDDPPQELIDSCSEFHLKEEIDEIRPDVIVCMGAIGNHLVPDLDLEYSHGLPYERRVYDHSCVVFPLYHPSSGMYQTSRIRTLRDDFRTLGSVIKGYFTPPVDEHPNPIYKLNNNAATWYYDRPIAIDTEDDGDNGIWSLQYSQFPGTGFMVFPGTWAWEDLRKNIHRWQAPIVMQNCLHDIGTLGRAGWDLPVKRIKDTMMRAWHRGYQQKGLKYMAWRLLGIKMQEFMELVVPYSKEVMLDYLATAFEDDGSIIEFPKPPAQRVLKDGEWKDYKPQSMTTKLKRMFTDLSKNPDIDLFERLGNWSPEEHRQLSDKLGPIPQISIKHVPLSKAVEYGCRDARATLEVYLYQKEKEARIR